MPYFPTDEEMAYKCPGCNKWYIPGQVQCLVLHSPGTCCHYGDREVSEPQPKQVDYERKEKV